MKRCSLLIIALGILFLAGCASSIFNEPVAISTKSIAARHTKPIEKVSSNYTGGFFVLIPIPTDPRDVYDDVLKLSKDKGGNAVTDVQLHSNNFFIWFFPTVVYDNWELSGTAVLIE